MCNKIKGKCIIKLLWNSPDVITMMCISDVITGESVGSVEGIILTLIYTSIKGFSSKIY